MNTSHSYLLFSLLAAALLVSANVITYRYQLSRDDWQPNEQITTAHLVRCQSDSLHPEAPPAAVKWYRVDFALNNDTSIFSELGLTMVQTPPEAYSSVTNVNDSPFICTAALPGGEKRLVLRDYGTIAKSWFYLIPDTSALSRERYNPDFLIEIIVLKRTRPVTLQPPSLDAVYAELGNNPVDKTFFSSLFYWQSSNGGQYKEMPWKNYGINSFDRYFLSCQWAKGLWYTYIGINGSVGNNFDQTLALRGEIRDRIFAYYASLDLPEK